MKALLGLDVGTAQTRGIAIDGDGRVLAVASADVPLIRLRPGWTEQHPKDWWQASREVLARVAADVGGDVAGLGLSGQMHGAAFLDENGEVIRPALLGSDQRAMAQCDQIRQRIGAERLIAITGNPALPGLLAPKILWLRDVEPVQYRHLRHVLLPKDYARFRLTGELATDVSDASGTLLFDLRRRDWSHQILAALEIPAEWLPAAHESGALSGRLSPPIASELGLPPGIPVAAGGDDQAAAAIGAGIVQEGQIRSSIGSGGVLFAHTEQLRIDPTGRLSAGCHAVPHSFSVMATTLTAGASLRWWRDILGGSMTDEQLATLASSAPPGAGGLFFLPYLRGGPLPDPAVRGAFVGLRAHHTKAHLTRAVMEGVIFSLRDGVESMRDRGLELLRIRATGKGAQSSFWRQLQANIFGLPVERPLNDDGPAYGAALLAGCAAGMFESVPDAAQRVRLRAGVNEPDPEQVRRYAAVYATYKNLVQAVQPPLPPQVSGATSTSVSEKVH